jgi:hypothetical protein
VAREVSRELQADWAERRRRPLGGWQDEGLERVGVGQGREVDVGV